MNDYHDVTVSELLKELHQFFLIDTHHKEEGFWVNEKALIDQHYWTDGEHKVEILRLLQSNSMPCLYSYKIILLSIEQPVILFEYDAIGRKIKAFRRGDWVYRLYKYFYHLERNYLENLSTQPEFQLIDY